MLRAADRLPMEKSSFVSWLPLVLFGVALNAAAQIALKYGAGNISKMGLTLDNALPIGKTMATNGFIWLGLALYALSVVNWVIVLSRVDVSAAYPILSLGFAVVALWGHYAFQEPLNAWRIAGIALIIGGTFCISRT